MSYRLSCLPFCRNPVSLVSHVPFAILCLTLLGCATPVAGVTYKVKWDALEQNVAGKTVTVLLTDATRVHGTVVSVLPDALQIQQKGAERNISRASVYRIYLRKPGVKWSLIGATVGLIAVPAVVASLSNHTYTAAYLGVVISIPAGAIGGYFAGRAYDHKKELVLEVVP